MIVVGEPGEGRTMADAMSRELSLTVKRESDVELLVKAIDRLAPAAQPRVVKFAEVFEDEALNEEIQSLGVALKTARKLGLIAFEGQLLLQGKDDDVPITLLEAGDTAEIGEPPEAVEIHYSDGESQQCAQSKAAFRTLESSGVVNDGTLVWMEGWDEWTPLSACRERLALGSAQVEPEPAPEPASEPAPKPAAELARESKQADEVAARMQVQWNGKGAFKPVYVKLTETTLTMLSKKGGRELCNVSVTAATVGLPKNERKGHPHCFRVDLDRADSKGHTKYICSVQDSGKVAQWMQAFMYGIGQGIQVNPLVDVVGVWPGTIISAFNFSHVTGLKFIHICLPILTSGCTFVCRKETRTRANSQRPVVASKRARNHIKRGQVVGWKAFGTGSEEWRAVPGVKCAVGGVNTRGGHCCHEGGPFLCRPS